MAAPPHEPAAPHRTAQAEGTAQAGTFTGAPLWLWPLAAPLAGIYGALGAARRWAYRRGWRAPARAACPVVSVGNLAVGGSGKSPLVDHLLRAALQAGQRPVCISRGYGKRTASHLLRVCVAEGGLADPAALGDEPAMLARRNPTVPVYVGRDRAAAARLAAVWDRPDLIVLDDAFQHLALARDLDLLLVDAARGLGNGRLLPLGPLREPLRAAARADAVLITKVPPAGAPALQARLQAAAGAEVPVFRCHYRPARLRRLDGAAELPPAALAGRAVHLECGIAQPESFAEAVRALGATVAAQTAHGDHHDYGAADLARLDAALAALPAAAAEQPLCVTTEKDAVKLAGRLTHPERLWVLEMAVAPEPAADAFFFDFIERRGIN